MSLVFLSKNKSLINNFEKIYKHFKTQFENDPDSFALSIDTLEEYIIDFVSMKEGSYKKIDEFFQENENEFNKKIN